MMIIKILVMGTLQKLMFEFKDSGTFESVQNNFFILWLIIKL